MFNDHTFETLDRYALKAHCIVCGVIFEYTALAYEMDRKIVPYSYDSDFEIRDNTARFYLYDPSSGIGKVVQGFPDCVSSTYSRIGLTIFLLTN